MLYHRQSAFDASLCATGTDSNDANDADVMGGTYIADTTRASGSGDHN